MVEIEKYAFLVSVETAFLPDQSSLDDSKYVFSYSVTIRNIGSVTAQLISRHWIITDANNQVQEVKGLGVVGAATISASDGSGALCAARPNSAAALRRASDQSVSSDSTMMRAAIVATEAASVSRSNAIRRVAAALPRPACCGCLHCPSVSRRSAWVGTRSSTSP